MNKALILIFVLISTFSAFGGSADLCGGSFQLSAAYAEADIAIVEKPFMEGRYEKAVSEAQQLIGEKARQRHEIYYLKGLSELKLKRFKEARESFEVIVSKYPKSNRVFDARVGIGDSFLLEGNTESAVMVYNEIKEKFPADKNIALVDSRLADCRQNAGPKIAAVETPQNEPAPVEASNGHISVQAGCFKSGRNADNLSAKLTAKGYESYVERPLATGDKLYRVKVGRFRARDEAGNIAARLNRDGYKTKICDDSACR